MQKQLFKADEMFYTVVPVSDYEDFDKYYQTSLQHLDETLAVVLINFGAMINVNDRITLRNTDSKIIIIDRHRPIALENALPNVSSIVLVDQDWEQKTESIRNKFNVFLATGGQDLDSDQEDDLDPDVREARKIAVETIMQYSDSDENYRITTPSCVLAYSLAEELGRTSNSLLWATLVGITWCWVRQEVTEKQYHQMVFNKWKTETIRLNPKLNPTSTMPAPMEPRPDVAKHVYGHLQSSATASHHKTSGIQAVQDFKFVMWRHLDMFTSFRNSPYIIGRMQLQTPEGRQDLLNALATWGISLEQAKQPHQCMDLPTKNLLTRALLGTHGQESMASAWGLNEVLFAGFVRWFGVGGWQGSASAMDCALAVQALLDGGRGWVKHTSLGEKEATERIIVEVKHSVEDGLPLDQGRASRPVGVAQQYGIATDAMGAAEEGYRTERRRMDGAFGELDKTHGWQQAGWKDRWMEAFLSFERGLRIAQHLQTSIVRGATSLMYNKATKKYANNTFRVVTIAPPTVSNAELGRLRAEAGVGRVSYDDWQFYARSSSTWMVQFGNCLLEMMKNHPKMKGGDVPLVMILWNGEQEGEATWTLRGFSSAKRKYVSCRQRLTVSPFPIAFSRLVEEKDVPARLDGFDPNVMQVAAKKLNEALDGLGEYLSEFCHK